MQSPATPVTRRRSILFTAVVLATGRTALVSAQAAPGADLTALERAYQDSQGKLADLRARLSTAAASLNQLELAGPGTSVIKERLVVVRSNGLEQIRVERARLATAADNALTAAANEWATTLRRLADERNTRDTAWERDYPRKRRQFQDLLAQGALTVPLEDRLAVATAEADALEQEKSQVMNELRAGYFCSKCDRSKSEIERQDKVTFEAHLLQVTGIAVMRPEKLREREETFDARIRDARGKECRLSQDIADNKAKYEKSVNVARNELSEMASMHESKSKGNEADRLATESTWARKQRELTDQKASDAARLQARETGLANVLKKLSADAARNGEQFKQKQSTLSASIASLRQEETALAARANAAMIAYGDMLRARRETGDRQEVLANAALRQNLVSARTRWADDAKTAALVEARGGEGSAAAQVRAAASRRDYEDRFQAPAGFDAGEVRSHPTLTGRAQAQLDRLPADIQNGIRKNIETFGNPVNAARAVVRHSLDSFDSSIRDSVVNRALGKRSSAAEDLAAASAAAGPSLGGTLKANLMPVLEDGAVDLAVAARQAEEQRDFGGQELVVERGFARTRLFGANLKKHFDGLFRTLDDTMNNISGMMGGEL